MDSSRQVANDADGRTPESTTSAPLTYVRIKRRRDDPAEPEIILEAAGAIRKQPRYDEVLLQLQGLSVVHAASAASATPRRRFRRLQTVDVAVLEAMSEGELMRLLRAQSGAHASTSTPTTEQAAGAQSEPLASGATATSGLGLGLGLGLGGASGGAEEQRGLLPRRPVKGAQGPTQETRIAALRTSHKQFGAVARYKQIRRKRELSAADGEAGGQLQMYDLERLPGTAARQAGSGLREAARRSSGRQAARDPAAQDPRQEIPERRAKEQAMAAEGLQRPRAVDQMAEPPRQAAAPAAGTPGEAGASALSEEVVIRERYAPLVEEYLRTYQGADHQQQQPAHRVPARPRRTRPAAASTQAPQPLAANPLAAPQPSQDLEQQLQAGTHDATDSAATPEITPAAQAEQAGHDVTLALEPAQLTATPAAVPATAAEPVAASAAAPQAEGRLDSAEAAASSGYEGHFVYDVYVPVPEDEAAERADGEEALWWCPDAPTASDLAVPVIEVAENDDEFFWAGELEAEAAQRAAEAEEHDSEDSNAESYYANTYPDEEDAPYGMDAGSGDGDGGGSDDEVDSADGDAMGYDWVGVGGRGPLRTGRDDDDENEEGDDDSDEFFGRRMPRVRPAGKAAYYRTEDDDYSEHSSFLSEEEERREAEERRKRAIFMH